MEKRTDPFFDRFTATQNRPRTFQIVTVVLVMVVLIFALTGFIHLLIEEAQRS